MIPLHDMAPVLDPLLTAQQSGSFVLPSRLSDPLGSHVARELIVLDSSVGDWRTLERSFADVTRGNRAEVLVLSPEVDGIRAIHDKLAEMGFVDTLHLVTHGSAGSIGLGKLWLDTATLDTRTDDLRDWQNYVTPGADMLLYGCDVAQGGMAESFLVDLGGITGTDIAASSDRTGSGDLHGDWDLEFNVGNVGATSLWTSASVAGWRHVLEAQVLYLDSSSTGSNASQMATSAPTATGAVPDFDGLDADPGRLLKRTNAGINEVDADQHHTWRYGVSTANPAHLNGAATLKAWAASKDFRTNRRGGLQAWLIDEDTGGGQTTIATGQVQQAAWASTFTEATISFGNLNYTVAAGHTLVVKLIAPNSISNDDMWIAYDTAAQSSRLVLTIDPGFGNQDPQPDSYTIAEDNTLAVTGGTATVGWQARRQITFNNASRTENLQDFPVLIRLDASTIDYRLTQDAGQDLRFVDGDGTVLAHEIERWDENGTSLVWVRVPTITASTNGDFIWMYYGNASAADGQNASGVWTGGYDAVYHLDENANASGDILADSSSHNFDGTNFESLNTAGIIGFGQEFDGVDDRIDLGANRAFLRGTSAATLSAWIAPDAVTGRRQIVGVSHGGSNTQSRASIELLDQNIVVQGRDFDAGINLLNTVVTTGDPLTAGAWHYVSAVIDYTGNSINIYVDGVRQTTVGLVAFLNGDTPNTNPRSTSIGSDENLSTAFFDGKADEVRIESVPRSAQWISAQYASQAGSFTSFGGEERATGVAANDVSPVLEVATVELVDGVSHGTLSLSANGAFTYTPNANYSGADSFRYQLRSASGLSVPMVVSLTVTPVNDPPIASADRYTLAEGGTLDIAVLANDSDPDNTLSASSIQLVSSANNGSVTLLSNGRLRYSHNGGETPSDTFQYRLRDRAGALSSVVTVSLNITPVNDRPVAVGEVLSATEDVPLRVTSSQLLLNDSDADGNPLTVSAILSVTHGTFVDHRDGTWTFSPTANFAGDALFSYRIADGQGGVATASATLRFAPVNDAPTGLTDSWTILEDDPIALGDHRVLANDTDVDGDAITARMLSGPSHGTMSLATNGDFTYIPAANFAGVDAYTYEAWDGQLSSGPVTVTLTIQEVNDAPTTSTIRLSVVEGGLSAPGNLLNFATDLEGDVLAVTSVSASKSGNVNWRSDGTFTFQHNGDESPTERFSYAITDARGGIAQGEVLVSVTPVNDAPLSQPDTFGVFSNGTLQLDHSSLVANDVDAEGAVLRVAIVDQPQSGTLLLQPNGAFVYLPAAGFVGADTFTYQASDGQISGAITTVTIAVAAPPVGNSGAGGAPAPVSAVLAPPPVNLPVIPLAEPKTIRTEESITDSGEIERVGDSGIRLNVLSANARIEIAASGTEADDLRLVSANVHERTTGITSATVPSHVMTASLGTIDLASLEITTPVGALMEGMAQELDSLRQDLSSTFAGTGVVTGGILVATSTFSVGYVIWAMRTGFLMASVLSSLPAWQTFDPVPLLNQMDDEGEVGDEDAAVEAMMDATE